MDVTHRDPWVTDWTAEDPLQIDFVDVAAGVGSWETGLRSTFEYRDLGLAAGSGGQLGAQHIRVVAGSSGKLQTGWHCHDLDFQFFYILKGWIKLRTQDGDLLTLRAGDSGYQPALYWHEEVECSPDYELFEITAPAAFHTIHGRDSELPARAAELDDRRAAFYTRDTDDSYLVGAGPRKFFAYRDLGTRAPTEGRIHLHTVRVAEGTPTDMETGWHFHTMAQWFFVLEGGADIRIESKPRRRLGGGDAVCIGSGPQMRHNVGPMAPDYKLVEMCIPAEYETTGVPAPTDAAL